jgi:CheY-like chemotaxis protein
MTEKPNLLLFEDNAAQVDLIIDSLSDDFDVTWVSNQKQLEEIISDEFNVIVTDVSIKDFDKTGYEMIDDFRRNIKITKTPIVVYSAKVNIADIEKEQGKLFFAYVDKGEKVMGDELLERCLEASKEKQNMVSWNVFQGYFEKIGKVNAELDSDDVGKLKFHGIFDVNTVKDLLEQLKKDDLDHDLWQILDELIWDFYHKFSNEEKE